LNHDDMIEPGYFDDPANVRKKIRLGLVNFVLTTLVYALGLYVTTRILRSADVISWRLAWVQCTSLAAISNIVRIWDRTFFH